MNVQGLYFKHAPEKVAASDIIISIGFAINIIIHLLYVKLTGDVKAYSCDLYDKAVTQCTYITGILINLTIVYFLLLSVTFSEVLDIPD